MSEQGYILKERLKSLIGQDTVKAALFYTFNFDPKLFENYIMPMLVPSAQFTNNALANNILWRRLYKDKLVPNITVYCDQHAKSIESGPLLDYNIRCINMPPVGKNMGNFHPKHSLILTENNGKEKLIFISGSNNISQGGWCENIECVSEHVLENNKFFPNEFRRDVKDFTYNILKIYGKNQEYTETEKQIDKFLNKRGYTAGDEPIFYNSFKMSFESFLTNNVLIDKDINVVEIISPFFKKDPDLLSVFQRSNLKIKIQAPLKNDYCMIDPDTFEKYQKFGASWCQKRGEDRNDHSKVYRFYSNNKVYTIIGSVNLTKPAWMGVHGGKNDIYNIESAILYTDDFDGKSYFLEKPILGTLKFLEESEESENNSFERIASPDIEFTIDWTQNLLKWKEKVKNPCVLELAQDTKISLKGQKKQLIKELKYADNIISALSRHPILKVIELRDNQEHIHFYYPLQVGFENRPLGYHFSASDILDAWDLVGGKNEILDEWLLSKLEICTDLAQNESGIIEHEVSQHTSLLNEMSRHFYGLTRLEQFLFDPSVFDKTDYMKKAHCNDLRYYLSYDNVDTLRSYLKDLEKLYREKHLYGGYYWLLLMIIRNNFYKNKSLNKMIGKFTPLDDVDRKKFKVFIKKTTEEIDEKLNHLVGSLSMADRKLKWASKVLKG